MSCEDLKTSNFIEELTRFYMGFMVSHPKAHINSKLYRMFCYFEEHNYTISNFDKFLEMFPLGIFDSYDYSDDDGPWETYINYVHCIAHDLLYMINNSSPIDVLRDHLRTCNFNIIPYRIVCFIILHSIAMAVFPRQDIEMMRPIAEDIISLTYKQLMRGFRKRKIMLRNKVEEIWT